MSTSRRTVLAGLAGLGATASLPAWAQAIRAQSDPWAQVDPYDDPRNGFPGSGGAARPAERSTPAAPAAPPSDSRAAMAVQGAAPVPPSPEEIASYDLMEALTDPEGFEILSARRTLYQVTVAAKEKQQGPLVANGAVQSAFRRFCEPFFAIADRRHLPWEVYVTDYPAPNGLAYGGGKITIASGTILYADHPAELAGIIAHEIGHNDRRHVTESKEIEALMTLAASGDPQFAGGAATALAKTDPYYRQLLSQGFSRQQEREADAHVPYMFEQLGMDANRYVTMFQKMMKIYNIDAARKTCLIDSHPAMMERIEALRSLNIGRGSGRNYSPPGWDELKRFYPTPAEYRWG